MNLTHAPVAQLLAARKAIKAVKALQPDYAKLYTSWNSRTKQVRVKFYSIGLGRKLPKALQAGFVGSNNGRAFSITGYF